LFPRSSRPKWSAVVVCGLLLTSNFLEGITVNRSHVCCPINQNHVAELTKAWISCSLSILLYMTPFWPHVFVAVSVMFPLACRCFGLSPFWCRSFDVRRFGLSPFWSYSDSNADSDGCIARNSFVSRVLSHYFTRMEQPNFKIPSDSFLSKITRWWWWWWWWWWQRRLSLASCRPCLQFVIFAITITYKMSPSWVTITPI